MDSSRQYLKRKFKFQGQDEQTEFDFRSQMHSKKNGTRYQISDLSSQFSDLDYLT
jgi:hypothetical protein